VFCKTQVREFTQWPQSSASFGRTGKIESDDPVLNPQIRQCFKIAIRRENDDLVLPAERCEHHVHLRKSPAFLPQFVEDFAVQASRVRIDGPQADVAQQLPESTPILGRLGRLLNASFQLAKDGKTRHEAMTPFALLMNPIPQMGY